MLKSPFLYFARSTGFDNLEADVVLFGFLQHGVHDFASLVHVRISIACHQKDFDVAAACF